MKTKSDTIFWGILLMAAGGLALAQQQGWIGIDVLSTQFWALAFGAAGLIFIVRYLVAGWRNWGWLFPVCLFAALSVVTWLAGNGIRDTWLAAPIFSAIGIPFLAAFAVDFRRNWWALIPAFVLTVICLMVVFVEDFPGEIMGAAIMFAIAIPFAVVYFSNREKKWALIPAFTLAVIGSMNLLALTSSRWIGAFVPFAISAPFFYVFFKYPKHWWALIPAGVMASIGINVLLTDPALGKFAQSSFPGAALFLGWAATFGWLWRQREKYPTTWARIPAMIASIVAIVLLAVGSLTEFGLAAALLVGGVVLIFLGLRSRKELAQ